MHSSTLVSGLMALGLTAAASFGNTTITASSTVAPVTAGPTAGVDVTTTVIEVTALTTFCPAPTQITTNGKTITVTAPGTITITDCPCKHTTVVPVVTPTPIVKGNDTIVWTTEVVPVFTTYCPAPTQITQGTKTYTVTKPTTLTITDCPCTISRPITKPTVIPTPYFNGTANATTIYTTQVVSTLTTYCPQPTTLTNVGTVPIPVLTPGTITVSNQCPCTVSKPITTQPVVVPVPPQTQPGNVPVGPTTPVPQTPGTPQTQNSATARNSIATGGASSIGSSIMAWIAAAAFAVVA